MLLLCSDGQPSLENYKLGQHNKVYTLLERERELKMTLIQNPEQEIIQAIRLKCRLVGIKLGSEKNISNTKFRQFLRRASNFTGLKYKRGEIQGAIDDLDLFIRIKAHEK